MPEAVAGILFAIALYGGIAFLSAFSLFAASRYRLSRARYRGPAFRLEGSPLEFAQSVPVKLLFCVLTLGLYVPVKAYWVLCIKGYFLSTFALGIYYFFWKPQMYTFMRKHLSLGGQRFQGSFTPGQFATQVLTNALLAIVTLGLATPWILVRDVQFRLAHLSLENPEMLEAAVKAEIQKGGATAESLAGVFDMDVGF